AGRMGGAEEEGSGSVDQEVADRLGRRDVPAQNADSLRQRSHLQVDPAIEAEMIDRTAAILAQHATGVGVVDHDQGAETLGPFHDAGQGSDVAVHAEDAIGDDQLHALVTMSFEMALEVVQIAVLEDRALGLREPDAVDDGSMVQFVADDDVSLFHQRWQYTAVP